MFRRRTCILVISVLMLGWKAAAETSLMDQPSTCPTPTGIVLGCRGGFLLSQLQNAKLQISNSMIISGCAHVGADRVPADSQVVLPAGLPLAKHFHGEGDSS